MKAKIILSVAVFAALLFVFSSLVRAEDSASETSEFRTPKPFLLTGTPRPFASKLDRLNDFRLKFCEKHHDEITNRSESLSKLVTNMLTKFDLIAGRVEEYYTTKVVPTGKVVTNYDALVADIAAKKTQVQTDLAAAQSDVSGFSCTGDNPKGQITQYRTDMQLVKKDLQAYRTSIKNLIVAVKSVTGEKESPKPTPSATP
jgi:peptidoglycan hydrolase CwlO-like protein